MRKSFILSSSIRYSFPPFSQSDDPLGDGSFLCFDYEVNGSEITITGIKLRDETEIIIPNGVTAIGEEAFCNCKFLSKVVIPDSVTSIGAYAFANCPSLKEIELGNGVTKLEEGTFDNCESLNTINIPANVTTIEIAAISGCSSLTNITVDSGNTHFKSIDGNLYSYDGKTLIQYAIGKKDKSFKVPDGVTSIGAFAFVECSSLTSITIPDSVTSIGAFAFCDCESLSNVKIGGNVTSIGEGAFRSTAYDENLANWEDDSLYLGKYLIQNNSYNVKDCSIKEGTTLVSGHCFEHTFFMESITIPSSVVFIGESAFDECPNLKDVYYKGTKEEWDSITFENETSNPTNSGASIHFNS